MFVVSTHHCYRCVLAEPKLFSKSSQQGVVKVLIVQICRVLDIIFDVDSPLVHTLPVCLAWKIFYHIVKGYAAIKLALSE